ncbi:Hypothetical predicted protein [Mytilus galloprovincialis]|uniref:Uncharacterized protein n=2 Tax=Mytilus galloprovincialis TaxID=29158 RepID=A0A8B6EYN9_MYTGA|nr:Hypothetical predicted protein [Mytilus galloprovincialis]
MNLYQMITLICTMIGGMATHRQKHTTCNDQFSDSLNKCMDTFTPYIEQYTGIKPKDPFLHHVFVTHVCKNYKKMLLCIHVLLTNCKTIDTMSTVQQKLGHDWVIQINQMCNIQSNSSKNLRNQQMSKDKTSVDLYKSRDKDKILSDSNTINNGDQNKILNEKQMTNSHSPMNEDLAKSALFNELMHSSDTDVEIITMFVFRSAPKTTQQRSSLPNSSNGADKQKLASVQKYKPLNLLELLISYCGTSSKDTDSVKYRFLAQNENSSDKNGTVRHFCWQVVVVITVTNYLYNVLR